MLSHACSPPSGWPPGQHLTGKKWKTTPVVHFTKTVRELFGLARRDRPRCLCSSSAPAAAGPAPTLHCPPSRTPTCSTPRPHRVTLPGHSPPASSWRSSLPPCCRGWRPLTVAPVAAAVPPAAGRGARPRPARGGWPQRPPPRHRRQRPPRLPPPLARHRVLRAALVTRRRRYRRLPVRHRRPRQRHPAPMPRFGMPCRPL